MTGTRLAVAALLLGGGLIVAVLSWVREAGREHQRLQDALDRQAGANRLLRLSQDHSSCMLTVETLGRRVAAQDEYIDHLERALADALDVDSGLIAEQAERYLRERGAP
jgi:hypothetical protein